MLFDSVLFQATVVISDDGQVLLTDFGFSDIVVSTFSMTDVSHRGREDVINWMSPEMFNLGSVSVEGDVWAFGMTALVCSSPFHVQPKSNPHRNCLHVKTHSIAMGSIHSRSRSHKDIFRSAQVSKMRVHV